MAKAPQKEKEPEAEKDAEAPAAEGEEGAAAPEGGKKKFPPMIFLIIGGVVILLLGGGAAAYFMGFLDGVLGKKPEVTAEHKEGEAGAEASADGKEAAAAPAEEEKSGGGEHGKDGKEGGADARFLEIPKMVVNLNTDDGTPRYLSLSVQLELKNVGDRGKLESLMPRVIDQFQTYLRELRAQDLRGSAGIYRLQTELLWRVNQAAAPIEVKDVLFQEILIQ